MMGLEIEQRSIAAYDVAGTGSNSCFEEFVIILIATNGLGKRDGFHHLRVEFDNPQNRAQHRHRSLPGKLVEHRTVFVQNRRGDREADALFLS